MFLKPAKLGEKEIPESILSEDKKHCKKIGPCGIGKEALYLNSFYLERRFYIPVSSVSRVFKRVAMSKGGFTGKGLFATMPYLVVVYEDGKEKQCNFKYEDQVDAFVASVKERFPQIKTVSEAAEKRLAEAEKKQAEKCLIPLSEQAKETVNVLEQAKEMLTEQDAAILAQRGVRQLTSKERQYYEKIIEAMRSGNPKQALNDVDVTMPETIINSVFDDLQTNHPLLSKLNATTVTGLTRMMLNTNGNPKELR